MRTRRQYSHQANGGYRKGSISAKDLASRHLLADLSDLTQGLAEFHSASFAPQDRLTLQYKVQALRSGVKRSGAAALFQPLELAFGSLRRMLSCQARK